jgi:hypothetical protein
MDENQFGYKQKFPKKTTLYVAGAGILPETRALRRSSVEPPAKAPVRQRLVPQSATEKVRDI